MMGTATEQRRNEPQFLLTGFTQTAGIRVYAFEGRVDARRIDYTVEVNLALIPGFGIRIQDLPLLCRGLLQQRAERDETSAFVLTEQNMRTHAEELARARSDAEHRKKQPRPAAKANPGDWRIP
jgi:hypothetical protein